MAFEIIDEEPKGSRFEIEEEPEAEAPAPAQKPERKPGRVQRALIGAIPFAGPFLRDTDFSGVLPGAVSGMSTIGQGISEGLTTSVDDSPAARLLVDPRNIRPARGVSDLVTGQKPLSPAEQALRDRRASVAQFNAERADDPAFEAARIVTPIAATLPAGGIAGRAVTAAAPRLAPLGEAISSGGFRLGANAPTGTLAHVTRAAGAAGNAAAQSLAMNEDAGTIGKAALIGSVMPGGVRVAERVGGAGANLLRRAFPGQAARDAGTIARVGDITDLAGARAALSQRGPHLVGPGGESVATTPQILMNPGVSQLQRAVRNAGDTRQLAADQAADVAREQTLARVGTVQPDATAARGNFGTALERNVRAADESARAAVGREYEAVDPLLETRIYTPVEKMRAAFDKFHGRGTPASAGGKAREMVNTAEAMSTETIPAVQATIAPSARKQGEDLFSAMKSLGGIKQDSTGAKLFEGELRDLKQSGARAVIQSGRGQSPDVLAQAMHARGFIPDDDPATLLNAMRDHAAGNRVFSTASDRGGAMKAGVERAMGEAPGETVVEKAVPFSDLQTLRSYIGEAHQEAKAAGRTREAASLDIMRKEIDAAVENVAGGAGREGEFFPKDIADQWKKANAAHKARMEKFRTGPQETLFKERGKRGGELAGEFFSPRLSQTEDIAAFNRIADPETTGLLKDVAVTELSGLRRGDRLSPAAVDRYLRQRGGAVRGLFGEGERAQLEGVRSSLNREAAADVLNNVKVGSNTQQNIDAALSNGFIDRPIVSKVANNIPVIGRPVIGPMLEAVKGAGKKARVERIGKLLAEPAELERALAALQRSRDGVPLNLGSSGRFSPLAYRALPLLGSQSLTSGQ